MNVNQKRGDIIVHRLGMNGQNLQQELADIQLAIVTDKKQMIATNPNWDVKKDMRITSLNNLAVIVARTGLGVEFLSELLDDDWWETHLSNSLPEDDKIARTVSFEQIIKYNFGMDFFTGIEAGFRAFLRALDPNACRSATAAFKSIYDCLLGSNQLAFSATDRQSAIEILDFIRLIRNLIHNSGVYFSEDGGDKEQIYKGTKYAFRQGKPVDFVTWALLLTLARDIHQLLVTIIKQPKIVAVTEITDPFSAHNW